MSDFKAPLGWPKQVAAARKTVALLKVGAASAASAATATTTATATTKIGLQMANLTPEGQ